MSPTSKPKRAASAPPRTGAVSKRRAAPALPHVTAAQKKHAAEILAALAKRYPDATCELDFTAPHELLIATILSAQSTDVGVNKATPALFKAFPTPAAFARAGEAKIAPYLRTINFWRMKAKAVAESMRVVHERFGGQVPRTMDELLALRGVARKTANVVLGTAFGINEGVVVDTHVTRLAQRFGLSRGTKPDEIERDLMALIPRDRWSDFSHMLILHGRRACKARGGSCADDPICRRFCSEGKAQSGPRGHPRASGPREGNRERSTQLSARRS